MRTSKELNQLYKQIQTLAPKFSWYYKLDDHEKNEAINNTLLKLLEKEEDGTIYLDKVDDYKGYLFITLKNAIGRILQSRNTIPSKARKYSREIEENDAVIHTDVIKLDLSQLTPINPSYSIGI